MATSVSNTNPANPAAVKSTSRQEKNISTTAADVAQQSLPTTTFSDKHAITTFSSTHAVTTFAPAIKITMGGKNFYITIKRPRKKTSTDKDKWYKKGSRWVYNQFNSRIWGSYEYLELSEDEEIKLSQELDKAWKKYSEEYKEKNGEEINIDDVLGIRLEINLKEDEPNFDKPFYFYVFVKDKDEDGNAKKYDKRFKFFKHPDRGDFKYKILHLNTGKVSKDDPLGLLATAFDFKVERTTYKTCEDFFKAQLNNFKEAEKTSAADEKDQEDIDSNICYLHAILNFMKGLKPKNEQKDEFSKSLSLMDKEAMNLKRNMQIKGSDQEDVHEILLKSPLIQNRENFSTVKSKYCDNPSWLTRWINPYLKIGEEEKSQDPIPFLSITDKKDLQDSLDKYHFNIGAKNCGQLKDDSGNNYQLTKEHTVFTTKPPYLMVGIKRFDNADKKIDTPITVSDQLELKAGINISKEAAGDQKSIKYSLKGFIYHEGESIKSGHYTTYMLDPDGKWRKFDNFDKDSYGKVVTETDEEFANRKKRAYLYLYTENSFDELSSDG